MALGCTVKELLNKLSSEELSEWIAYDRVEPFGGKYEDLRFARLANVIAASGGASEEFAGKVFDFMLGINRQGKMMTEEQIKNTLMKLKVKK